MKLKDEWYEDVEKELSKYFFNTYFLPLLELLKEPLYNSADDVVNAILSGKITIKDKNISGTYNLKISKELSKFAKFNEKSKTWTITGTLPSIYQATSANANAKSQALHKQMQSTVESIANTSKDKIKNPIFNISAHSKEMENEIEDEYKRLGISYKPNESIRNELLKQYNESMKLNIVNPDDPENCWDTKQVQRLRDTISKSISEGTNKKTLMEMIQNEMEISRNKAKFLARQETSLFLSTLREERFKDAGVKLYEWMTSDDSRVVGNPSGKYPVGSQGHKNHYALHHKICKYDDATVYAENLEAALKNEWKSRSNIGAELQHPGRAFLCRCISKPIIT